MATAQSNLANFTLATADNQFFTGSRNNDLVIYHANPVNQLVFGTSNGANSVIIGPNKTTFSGPIYSSNVYSSNISCQFAAFSNMSVSGTVSFPINSIASSSINGLVVSTATGSNQSFSNVYSSNITASNASFSNIYTSTVTATTFTGALVGNAATATSCSGNSATATSATSATSATTALGLSGIPNITVAAIISTDITATGTLSARGRLLIYN